eukprot:TRINITY_DN5668_c0_g3_i2.p1 TRINITY_DN5668_c0_g3~~TRINITY_DN5668_c0_g3_i2.p1  ORF type:complete len:470 (+),score=95.85 TRINITY_DN5668_c0_g3_i2:123-1412(+)
MTDRVKLIAICGLFKTAVGTGVLSMPRALESTGILLFPVLMLGFCLVSQYSCYLVAKTLDMMHSIGYTNLDPLKVAEFAIGKPFGTWSTLSVVFLDPWGSTVAFFITIADILVPILRDLSQSGVSPISQTNLILILAVLVYPLMLYKDINEIAWVNILGMASLLAFALGILINLMTHYQGYGEIQQADFGSPAVLALTVIAFAYDGCQMNIFPYYRDLPAPAPEAEETKGEVVASISGMANLGAACCYMMIAYMGVGTYGLDVQNDIMNNFTNGWFFLSIKFAFAFTLLLTIPVTLFECANVIREHHLNHDNFTNIILNAALVGSAACVAIFVPDMYKAFAYVGATTGTLWTMVLPPLWYINTAYNIYPPVRYDDLESELFESHPFAPSYQANMEKAPPPSATSIRLARAFMCCGCAAIPFFIYVTAIS